jgi:hypothetical protein
MHNIMAHTSLIQGLEKIVQMEKLKHGDLYKKKKNKFKLCHNEVFLNREKSSTNYFVCLFKG